MVLHSKRKKDKSKEKKYTIIKKTAMSALAVILVFILGIGTYAVYYFNKIRGLDPGFSNSNTIVVDPDINPPPTDDDLEKDPNRIYGKLKNLEKIVVRKPNDPDVENILFMGLDGFGINRAARSDSMNIISINHKTNTVKMVSVLRDMYMKMPNWKGGIKLNEGYHYGGPGMTINMINYFLDMDIQKYVIVDFEGFPKIINTIGGIETEITDKEAGRIPGLKKGGTYVLSGQQALAYARIRKIDSDFARSKRQRTLLIGMLEKFWKADILTKFSVVDKLANYVSTNLTAGEIYELSRNKLDKINHNIESFTVPSHGNYRQIASPIFYFYMDYNSQKQDLHRFLYGTIGYVNYTEYDLGNRQYDKNNPSKYAVATPSRSTASQKNQSASHDFDGEPSYYTDSREESSYYNLESQRTSSGETYESRNESDNISKNTASSSKPENSNYDID